MTRITNDCFNEVCNDVLHILNKITNMQLIITYDLELHFYEGNLHTLLLYFATVPR